MDNRQVSRIISGHATADGAGVRLRRYIGSAELDQIDPFLLLDLFESDNPDDYIAGFPSHPHRGFETVTYIWLGKSGTKITLAMEELLRVVASSG